MIPHISPITSLQKLDTLSAFCLNERACLAPFIFYAFILCIGVISAAVTATPIISKTIPKIIKNVIINIPITTLTFGISNSDKSEKTIEIINAIIVILTIQFILALVLLLKI